MEFKMEHLIILILAIGLLWVLFTWNNKETFVAHHPLNYQWVRQKPTEWKPYFYYNKDASKQPYVPHIVKYDSSSKGLPSAENADEIMGAPLSELQNKDYESIIQDLQVVPSTSNSPFPHLQNASLFKQNLNMYHVQQDQMNMFAPFTDLLQDIHPSYISSQSTDPALNATAIADEEIMPVMEMPMEQKEAMENVKITKNNTPDITLIGYIIIIMAVLAIIYLSLQQ